MGEGSEQQKRLSTALGWFVGGGLALLLNYFVYIGVGEGYPIGPASFAAFVAGAFAGMWAADRLGDKALKVLGISAGLLISASTLAGIVLAAR